MKKQLFAFALVVVALCASFVSCDKENNGNNSNSQFIGVYDLDIVYDSITTSDGTWFSEEFFETMTGKVNPPEHGYLTIEEGQNGKINVTATVIKSDTGVEKVLFSTTATEQDNLLVLDNCASDYYYSTTEETIHFVFRNFANRLPEIYFKGIYTINLGADYSYLLSFTCNKRAN